MKKTTRFFTVKAGSAMKIKGDSIALIRVIFIISMIMAMTGCATSRTVTITPFQSESKSMVQLPLSVRVELKGVKQEDPNPVTPIFVDRASLKDMFITYLNTRNIFHSVLDSLSDSMLNVDVRYRLDSGNYFAYIVSIKASLISKDGLELGKFSGQGIAKGGTRFFADADNVPINKAMEDAIEDLCMKIEESRTVILAKLGRTVSTTLEEPILITSAKPKSTNVAGTSSTDPMSAIAVRSDVDELPSIKTKQNKNAYAVVIGIENYRQKLPKADYAVADAKIISDYLTKTMGYPEENVIILLNDRALKSDMEKYFDRWLSNNVEENGRVFIYYSGHGAPNTKTGDAYLVPYDGDPTFIAETGYPIARLYESLGKLKAREITVVLDSCFSGAGGRSVLAKGAKPLVITINAPNIKKNIAVMTASSGDQISSAYEEQGHGLFTYFLLKGIKNGDVVKPDGSIKMDDLFSYLKPQVERIARKQYNNEQTPQLIGAKNN